MSFDASWPSEQVADDGAQRFARVKLKREGFAAEIILNAGNLPNFNGRQVIYLFFMQRIQENRKSTMLPRLSLLVRPPSSASTRAMPVVSQNILHAGSTQPLNLSFAGPQTFRANGKAVFGSKLGDVSITDSWPLLLREFASRNPVRRFSRKVITNHRKRGKEVFYQVRGDRNDYRVARLVSIVECAGKLEGLRRAHESSRFVGTECAFSIQLFA